MSSCTALVRPSKKLNKFHAYGGPDVSLSSRKYIRVTPSTFPACMLHVPIVFSFAQATLIGYFFVVPQVMVQVNDAMPNAEDRWEEVLHAD